MSVKPMKNWIELVHTIGKDFETRAEKYDRDDLFVAENYSESERVWLFQSYHSRRTRWRRSFAFRIV
ncbi:MAG: hypothetical protein U5J96_09095 [Ignavibacteriaceae bacterium]|nr:hypothetical protein [Ignavibacteriaceae bacterium]